MRQTTPGLPPRLAFGAKACLLLTLFLTPLASTFGQAAKSTAPEEFDTRPAARYVPKDAKYTLYIESLGLRSQNDTWKKTAAYKMLTETTLGETLEMMATQTLDPLLAFTPNSKVSASEILKVAEHAANHGFVIAFSEGSAEQPHHQYIVLKGATAREVRPIFSRLMGSFMGASKPSVAKKGTRTIVLVGNTDPEKGDGWAWWAEQNDLVICDGWDVDTVIATLDAKKPNAVEAPFRTELFAPKDGFTPIMVLRIDPMAVGASSKLRSIPPELADLAKNLNASAIDFRSGFHEDAIMTVTRLKTPKPYTSPMLAYFNQPSFAKSAMPPLPSGSEAFTVVSVDVKKTFDLLIESGGKDGPGASLSKIADDLKKSKIDLRKDILSHLGPKVAFYTLPGGTTSASGEAAAGTEAAAGSSFAGLFGAGSTAGIVSSLLGSGPMPRYVMTTEVDNPATFGRTLDTMMIAVNKILREQATAAEKTTAAAAAATPGSRPGGGQLGASGAAGDGPGGGGYPGASTKTARGPVAAPEFRKGTAKEGETVYTLYIPPSIVKQFPAGFKPSVRLAGKYMIVATTADVAKQAGELKPGAWSPAASLASAFSALPVDLIAVLVSDPRPTEAESLASLPGNVQRLVSTITTASQPPAAGTTPPAGGANGMAGYPGMGGRPGRGNSSAGSGLLGAGPAGGGGAVGSMPGGGGTPSPDGGNNDAAGFFKFNISAAKLPKADALKALMFPRSLAVSSTDQELTFTTREAFPSFDLSPRTTLTLGVILPQFMSGLKAGQADAMKAMGLDPAMFSGTPPTDEKTPPAGGDAPGAPPAGGGSLPGGGSRPGGKGGSRPGGENR